MGRSKGNARQCWCDEGRGWGSVPGVCSAMGARWRASARGCSGGWWSLQHWQDHESSCLLFWVRICYSGFGFVILVSPFEAMWCVHTQAGEGTSNCGL